MLLPLDLDGLTLTGFSERGAERSFSCSSRRRLFRSGTSEQGPWLLAFSPFSLRNSSSPIPYAKELLLPVAVGLFRCSGSEGAVSEKASKYVSKASSSHARR